MKLKPVAVYVLIVGILFSVSPVPGQDAEEKAGQIVSVENTVTVTRADGQESPAQAGLPLYAGDTLVTGENSRVKFSLSSNTDMFELGESSEMAVDELSASAEEDGEPPVIRLTAGFLRSVIGSLKGEDVRPAVQTPTAVAGIRGTAFDTVVSLDGTTAFAVDEGSVEVEWESGKEVLETGQSAEVDEETESMKPLPAFGGKDRKWKEWRGKKEKDMQGKLRTMLPRFRKRFEKAGENYAAMEKEITDAQAGISAAMEAVRKAEASANPHAVAQAMHQFEQQSAVLRNTVRKSRLYANQCRAMNRQWAGIENYAKKNKDRFSPEDFREIEAQDEFFQMRGKELKADSGKKISDLKHMAKEMRKFRKERGKGKLEYLKKRKEDFKKERLKKEHGEQKERKDSDAYKQRKKHDGQKERKEPDGKKDSQYKKDKD